MSARPTQRIVDAIPVGLSALVGTLTAVSLVSGSSDALVPAPLWITGLALFLVALAGVTVFVERIPDAAAGVTYLIAWLLGAGLIVAAPAASWLPIITVFTAFVSAYLLPTWGSAVVIAVNCGAVAGSVLIAGAAPTAVLFGTGIYALLQISGVLSVRMFMREFDLRRDLEATNVELRATRELLAESTRVGERTRIARDLHDVLGHQLTVLALELETASHRSDEPARTHVLRAREVARGMLADVRATVGAIRTEPGALDEALAAVVAGISSPAVTLRVADVRLPSDRIALFVRAVQELLTNAIRHAEASSIIITVTADDAETVLTVQDDGRGGANQPEGNGLTGLRERVAEAGGSVLIERTTGDRGFSVTVTVPTQVPA